MQAVAILLLLGSLLAGLRAFWTRKYATAPQLDAVTAWMTRDETWLKWRFLGNIKEAESENSKKLQRKVRWLGWSLGMLFVDICLSGGYLLWMTVR